MAHQSPNAWRAIQSLATVRHRNSVPPLAPGDGNIRDGFVPVTKTRLILIPPWRHQINEGTPTKDDQGSPT